MTRLLIVGGGIAGLTLGHALLKHAPEVDFDLIEKVPAQRPAGAGIILAPNALPVLDGLGLYGPLRDHGHFLPYNQLCDHQGRTLQKLKGPEDRLLSFHRADLHQVLQDGLKNHLQQGISFQGQQQSKDQVQVQLSSGEVRSYDLLVGADGLRSKVRESCGGPDPVYSGYTSWRTVLTEAPHLPGASELWGHGRRLGLVPLSRGRIYLYFTLNARQNQDFLQGDACRIRELFAEFEGADQGLLERFRSDTPLIHTDIAELPHPYWGKNRTVLIGDAAHALTPNLGQGAGMGIEDAVLLAKLLGQHREVKTVLSELGRIRHPRVQTVQMVSRCLGKLGQLQNPTLVGLRDRLMRAGPANATPDWLWTPPLA
ncbi:FAD-dependent monooxygenase [Deinococcus roseus]|uniref:2-heptyl-3-hydroxy-4(1H)-quinolone synthase n=1 Tax=Deinococcus roseus TaxID=392414 RepID=A0ABQ2DCN9_9DEIO|nr:FAD-dependent monooxygenase [Deinococcus roseus]GGJ53443.1 2-heptyl-3-hydroxy-4(1H)-quinolone synthase [Deinococcus roseus]